MKLNNGIIERCQGSLSELSASLKTIATNPRGCDYCTSYRNVPTKTGDQALDEQMTEQVNIVHKLAWAGRAKPVQTRPLKSTL